MKDPIKSDREYEDCTAPLVGAFGVPRLADACRVLFISGENFVIFPDLGQIGLVTANTQNLDFSGPDLLCAHSKLDLKQVARKAWPPFVREVLEPIIAASVTYAATATEDMHESVVMAHVVQQAQGQLSGTEVWKRYAPYLGDSIRPAGNMAVGYLFNMLSERFRKQHQLDSQFDAMAAALEEIGFLSTLLSVAICPKCHNFELSFSPVKINGLCTKCRSDWPVLTVSEFPKRFAELKKSNRDLPVFVSCFLRMQSVWDIKAFPNAELTAGRSKLEVDDYLPQIKTGIECKCFTNNIAVADGTVRSEATKAKKQVEGYLKLGLDHVILVVNYTGADLKRFDELVRNQLGNVTGLQRLETYGANPSDLSRMLQSERALLDSVANSNFDTGMTKRLEAGDVKTEHARSRAHVSHLSV